MLITEWGCDSMPVTAMGRIARELLGSEETSLHEMNAPGVAVLEESPSHVRTQVAQAGRPTEQFSTRAEYFRFKCETCP